MVTADIVLILNYIILEINCRSVWAEDLRSAILDIAELPYCILLKGFLKWLCIEGHPLLRSYRYMKPSFKTEPYLYSVKYRCCQLYINQPQTSSHILNIERRHYIKSKSLLNEKVFFMHLCRWVAFWSCMCYKCNRSRSFFIKRCAIHSKNSMIYSCSYSCSKTPIHCLGLVSTCKYKVNELYIYLHTKHTLLWRHTN